jgi:hypothetical protein
MEPLGADLKRLVSALGRLVALDAGGWRRKHAGGHGCADRAKQPAGADAV